MWNQRSRPAPARGKIPDVRKLALHCRLEVLLCNSDAGSEFEGQLMVAGHSENTPPSISDCMMPRFTSSARLGWGLNIRGTENKRTGFHRLEQESFRYGTNAEGYDL